MDRNDPPFLHGQDAEENLDPPVGILVLTVSSFLQIASSIGHLPLAGIED